MANKFQLTQRDRVGKSLQDAQKNKLMFYKGKDGKKKANVTKEELEAFKKRKNDKSLTLRDYLNEMQGKKRKIPVIKAEQPVIKRKPTKEEIEADKETYKKQKIKPTTNIFKVKKGESTTRAADAKAKKEAAQKKAGRGLTNPPVYGFPKLAAKVKTAKQISNERKEKDNKNKKDNKGKTSLLKKIGKALGPTEEQKKRKQEWKAKYGKNKTKKVTSAYTAKPKSISYNKGGGKIKYNKGGGDLFVARAYGGKIGN